MPTSVQAEDSLPSAVIATASIRTGSVVRQLPTSTTQNVIDTNLEHYYIDGLSPASGAAARRQVNLNTASPSDLMTLSGVDAAAAQLIIARRPTTGYRDRDDFITRLAPGGMALWHAMSSTAGGQLLF